MTPANRRREEIHKAILAICRPTRVYDADDLAEWVIMTLRLNDAFMTLAGHRVKGMGREARRLVDAVTGRGRGT